MVFLKQSPFSSWLLGWVLVLGTASRSYQTRRFAGVVAVATKRLAHLAQTTIKTQKIIWKRHLRFGIGIHGDQATFRAIGVVVLGQALGAVVGQSPTIRDTSSSSGFCFCLLGRPRILFLLSSSSFRHQALWHKFLDAARLIIFIGTGTASSQLIHRALDRTSKSMAIVACLALEGVRSTLPFAGLGLE